jgi:cytochrome c5
MFPIFSFAIIFAVVVGALVAKSNMGDRNATLVVTQATSLQDGDSLINSRCARCHTVELLKQTKQTRAEWENTLAQMANTGVNLSDEEKIVLIDFLTDIDTP